MLFNLLRQSSECIVIQKSNKVEKNYWGITGLLADPGTGESFTAFYVHEVLVIRGLGVIV